MKKTLLAMAVLAASGATFAQSSVTLFGVVDAAVSYGKGDGASKTALTNSGLNSSRLGFRGVEDLGGGMNASFWLEAGLANDDGQGAGTNANNQSTGAGTSVAGRQGLTFNRRSTVSLGGSFGEVRLGRDYTPHFWNHTVYDPFGTNGVGTSQLLNSSIGGITTVRASNSIGYFLPGNIGGAFGQVQVYMGENASGGAKDGNGFSLRGGYAAGPVSVAAAYGKTKYASGDIATANIGGFYDAGMVKISALYDQDKVTNGATGKGALVGLNAPIGAGEVRAAYSTYKVGSAKTNKLAVGYVHNLSKRTAVYTTFATLKNSGGAAQTLNGGALGTGTKSTGLDFGVKHSF